MRRFAGYLLLQLKRTAKAYIGILALTLVLLVGIAAIGGIMLENRSEDEAFVKLKLGIVGNQEDKMLNLWIAVIREADSSSIAVDFISCADEDSAIEQMRRREIDSYVVVPDGFVESLMYGDNIPLKYVMARSGASMSTQITKDVIDVISNYIIETQAGVTAMYEYARDLGYKSDDRTALDLDMSVRYIGTIFDRDTLVSVQEIGLGNNLSTVGYYVCGLSVFFVMILGVAFCTVRVKSDRTLDRLLYSRGFGTVTQVMGEYLPYLLAVAVTLLVPATVAGVMSELYEFGVIELEDYIFRDYILLIIRLVPAVFVITAMQFLLYEVVSGMINSVLLQFITTIVMGYIGGCFYPLYFMPESVQKVASLLPSGVAFNYLSRILTDNFSLTAFAVCMLYGAVLVALAAVSRKVRIGVSEGAT